MFFLINVIIIILGGLNEECPINDTPGLKNKIKRSQENARRSAVVHIVKESLEEKLTGMELFSFRNNDIHWTLSNLNPTNPAIKCKHTIQEIKQYKHSRGKNKFDLLVIAVVNLFYLYSTYIVM